VRCVAAGLRKSSAPVRQVCIGFADDKFYAWGAARAQGIYTSLSQHGGMPEYWSCALPSRTWYADGCAVALTADSIRAAMSAAAKGRRRCRSAQRTQQLWTDRVLGVVRRTDF